MQDSHISLAHGNGGRFMRELIEDIFARHLHNSFLDTQADAVTVPVSSTEIVVTTDGFTVQPLEFPGGTIGSLAVHGTANDLAVAGAKPCYLTLNAFIEEGLECALLERIVADMAAAARALDLPVIAGDTKVLRRGEGGGVYFATTGIGVRDPRHHLSLANIRAGDAVLVSGPVGDHGIAVMLAREQFGLRGDVCSDAAAVLPLTEAMLAFPALRFMRDPTRGGLVSVAHEIARASGHAVHLQQAQIPVRPAVQAVCEMLGYDPYYLACEGRVVAIIGAEQADAALAAWRAMPQGSEAACIGTIETAQAAQVILRTELGGARLLEELEDDPLPRIC
jgi:hydrogenase expression/formation protein HypE